MLKFFIILAVWITPGILLFSYLLWISKRHKKSSGDPAIPATQQAPASSAEINPWAPKVTQPALASLKVAMHENEELEAVGANGSRR